MLIWQESLRKSWSRQNSPGEISTALLGASIVHHFQRMTRGVSAWLGHIVSTLIVSTLTISVRRRERNIAKEITLAQLQTMVERSGLKLTEEEVEKLLPGVNRSHNQILELRKLITDSSEPASAFAASRTEKSSHRWR